MKPRGLFAVAGAVTWAAWFAGALIAPSWWNVGAIVTWAWLFVVLGNRVGRLGNRVDARRAATEQSLMVDREVRVSLTDEALAWAVATWRKRYL